MSDASLSIVWSKYSDLRNRLSKHKSSKHAIMNILKHHYLHMLKYDEFSQKYKEISGQTIEFKDLSDFSILSSHIKYLELLREFTKYRLPKLNYIAIDFGGQFYYSKAND